ncbi:MAG: hypothetical protein KKE20_07340 [Nanoarchaeota archaeon]|nr:hypothetical protein [Nanoarchaeota archaeon]
MGNMRFKTSVIFVSLFILFSLLSFTALAQRNDANVSVTVERMENTASLITILVLAALFVVLLIVVLYLLKYISLQQKKKRALREKIKIDADEKHYREEHKEDTSDLAMDAEVDKYLKEDEKTVVNILRQRGGVVSQATLRIAGNFSKATLSRLLKELEQRNVIKKEQRGKKNLVILK